MQWFTRPLSFRRLRLRRAALRYADHGWDVTPGARLAGPRFICNRYDCPILGCHPALEHWEAAATRDTGQVNTWWAAEPHSVLLTTGSAFDVLEVPGHLGLPVLQATQALRSVEGPGRGQVCGPVAVTPTGRWMFLVRPGDPLRPELADQPDVVRHGHGSWVPAPPTLLPEGAVRWVMQPEETHWRLADSYAVQRLLLDARTTTSPIRFPVTKLTRPAVRPAA
jgi:hypothetical protein